MPAPCLLCGGAGGADGLCPGCLADLPWQSNACARCASPLPEGRVCGACLRSPPVLDEVVCLFDYAPPVDYMIQRLKFGRDLAFARALGGLMAARLVRCAADRSAAMPEAIVPVPLHRRRLAERGFNQALELARPAARGLAVPVDGAMCMRTKATEEQSALGAVARRANVRNAFAVRRLPPVRVAIVDDVSTTGCTAASLALALKQAGARHVSLWICARAHLSRS